MIAEKTNLNIGAAFEKWKRSVSIVRSQTYSVVKNMPKRFTFFSTKIGASARSSSRNPDDRNDPALSPGNGQSNQVSQPTHCSAAHHIGGGCIVRHWRIPIRVSGGACGMFSSPPGRVAGAQKNVDRKFDRRSMSNHRFSRGNRAATGLGQMGRAPYKKRLASIETDPNRSQRLRFSTNPGHHRGRDLCSFLVFLRSEHRSSTAGSKRWRHWKVPSW